MIAHHLSDESLARYAAGTLPSGPRLIARLHLADCAQCAGRVSTFECIGGALLEEMTPAAIRPDAFASAMVRLAEPERTESAPAPILHPDLPSPLNTYPIGPWRYITPSFQWRRVTMPEAPSANVVILKAAPGQNMPHHGHRGTEFTQVLIGSYSDEFGRYRAGDCIEMDDEDDHQPVADADGECICIAAIEGRLKLSGWIARLMQPLIGI